MPLRHPIILLKSNQFNMTAVSVNRSILKLVWTSERSNSVQTTCDREYTSRTRQHQKSISNRQVILVTQRAQSAVVCPDQIWLRFLPDFPFLERSTYDLSKARMSLTPAILVSIMARGSFSTNSFLCSQYSSRAFALDFGLVPALPPQSVLLLLIFVRLQIIGISV